MAAPSSSSSAAGPVINGGDPADGLSADQRAAYEAVIYESRNVCLTGSAGTGKTFLLRRIVNTLRERYMNVSVVAPTWIAALSVGGSSIHSWAVLNPTHVNAVADAHKLLDEPEQKQALERLRDTDWLVIDEISMVSAEMMDRLDYVLRLVRECPEEPFGGLRVIVCGDFAQLPPVCPATPEEKKEWTERMKAGRAKRQRQTVLAPVVRPAAQYAFQSNVWNKFKFRQIDLVTPFRHDDPQFVRVLQKVRMGIFDASVKSALEECRGRVFLTASAENGGAYEESSIEPTELYPKKERVNAINAARLAMLPGPTAYYEVDVRFDERDKAIVYSVLSDCRDSWNAPNRLALKNGAQVMLLCQLDTKAELVNGSLGVVVSTDPENKTATVEFANGEVRTIEYHTWEFEIPPATHGDRPVKFVRRQLPLRLAWAMTIHKSQGLTLDRVRTDITDCFAPGHAYVALSRVRSLTGLRVAGYDEKAIMLDERVRGFYGWPRPDATATAAAAAPAVPAAATPAASVVSESSRDEPSEQEADSSTSNSD